MDKVMLIKMLLKRVDVKGLIVEDLFENILGAKLKELAAKTNTPIDDPIVAFLIPELSNALGEQIDKLLAPYLD